jgi:MFS family permease
VVATIGYTAFIAGPPLLGFLGDHFGILQSLLAVGALLVVALLALPAVREPERAPSEDPSPVAAE